MCLSESPLDHLHWLLARGFPSWGRWYIAVGLRRRRRARLVRPAAADGGLATRRRRPDQQIGGPARAVGEAITQLLQGGQLPYLQRLILEAEDLPDPDVVFERRLAMVLDGLAAGIGRPG